MAKHARPFEGKDRTGHVASRLLVDLPVLLQEGYETRVACDGPLSLWTWCRRCGLYLGVPSSLLRTLPVQNDADGMSPCVSSWSHFPANIFYYISLFLTRHLILVVQEMDLVLSAASTFLMPALQFVFVTSNSCVVPLNVIERGQLPPSSILTKIFWSSDVESLREEFASVRELGAPAAEEWQKGLSKRGSDQRADITKWEKYADSGGVANMRTLLHPGIKVQSAVVPEPSQSTERTQLPTAGKLKTILLCYPFSCVVF